MKRIVLEVDDIAVLDAYEIGERQVDNIVNEPVEGYVSGNHSSDRFFINPFQDKFFKKIFASETSKEVLRSFLNGVLDGKRYVHTVTYGKNEYPGEIDSEGNAAFDVICTDADGAVFLVEIQQEKQRNFKERSVYYAGRLISDQAPKGAVHWKYKLKDVYVICLLTKFNLPNSKSGTYLHKVGLCNKDTGELFYKNLEFIYVEIKKFNKQKGELQTSLDEWLYALKNAGKMSEVPAFFQTPALEHFFQLARFSNLTPEERTMYRTKQQNDWDNRNAFDFAREEGHEQGHEQGLERGLEQGSLAEKREVALEMKLDGVNIDRIVKYTKLSREQIEAL